MVNEINENTQHTGLSEQQQSASSNQLNQSSQSHEPGHKSPLPLRMRLARVRRPAVMSLAIHPHIRRLTDALFIVLFLAQSAISLLLLQWSINPKLDLAHDYIFSLYFAQQVFFSERHMLLFNLLLLMAINMGAILLTNQFWIGSALFCAIVIIYSIANRLKMMARNEPILASDVTLATGNAGEIASFIPDGSTPLIAGGVAAILAISAIALAGSWYFGPGHILTIVNRPVRWVTQIVLASILFVPIGMYAATVGDVTSTAHAITMAWGDQAKLFDAQKDSNLNGTLVSFFRGFYVKVIDKPADYSRHAMTTIAHRYRDDARRINENRSTQMTDHNVIVVLSETFADPARVPGIRLNHDPIPSIREIKNQTTSGLMLSSGYGGGTANLEFQALTGLSTVNFNPSLKSPYQQFVPTWHDPVSFNQLWNVPGSDSVAFHAANGLLYLRHSNYKKFGFSHFWTCDGPEYARHEGKVENNPLVSDRDSYKNVTDYLHAHPSKTHFVQMETIQNHMPYPGNYYSNNPFTATSTQGASTAELGNINTYSRGLQYTDMATREFLADLDALDEPTTVIWYGDHLPGIYANEIDQPNYALTMHETDYFIWSNKASKKVGNKAGKGNSTIPNADFTSPNYFMAQAAQHMDAKVTPFIAFLTQAHEHVPAIQSPLETKLGTDWDKALADEPVYLSQTGYRINTLDEQQKQLVNDYKLITYDLTLGDHYLQKMGFTNQIPED